MAGNKLSGNIIGLEISGNFIACETSCEINFDADMRPASPVDAGGWKSFIPGLKGWTVNLNAQMLITSAQANQTTILNAFMSGDRIGIRFASKFTDISNFELKGYAYIQNGGISAAVNTNVGYTTTLLGDGALNPDENEQEIAQFGFRNTDPFGDEENLVPQFSKLIDPLALSIPFNFTPSSTGNYLFIIVPVGTTDFNKWENNDINFGDIPDFVWRAKYTIGLFDYYVTLDLIYFTSAVPTVTLKLKSTTPNSFTFVDIASALRNTEYESNEIEVAGITEPVPISISGGIGYSINGGAYTNLDGLISNGDKVRVKLMSSASYLTLTSAVLTIGGVSDSYDVTTQEDAALSYAYNTGVFYKEGCISPQYGTSVPFSRTYTGVDPSAAEAARVAGLTQFNLDGRANANSIGYCANPPIDLWAQITEQDEETVGTSEYGNVVITFYKGVDAVTPPAPIEGNRVNSPIPSIYLQYRQEGTNPATPVTFDYPLYLFSSNSSFAVVAPDSSVGNPVYPKQLLSLSDGTFFYFAAPGKANNEVFYVGSY